MGGVLGERGAELDAKYETLVTPAPWTSCTWGMIYASEGVFAVAQLCVGPLRGSSLVEAVAQMWILTCASQILWFVLRSQELLVMSFALAVVLAVTLLFLLNRADVEEMTFAEFWLLRAPFSVHAAWALVLSGQNLNVVASMMLLSPETLLALAYTTLVCTLAVVIIYRAVASKPDAIILGVVVWSFGGTWTRLSDPDRLNSPDKFDPYQWDRGSLDSLRWTCLGCACVALSVEAIVAARRASADNSPRPKSGEFGRA